MQVIDADLTRSALPMPALVAALRAMFTAGCEVPQRQAHEIGGTGTLLLMPAWRPGAFLGVKAVTIYPGNGALGLPGVQAAYTLFDASTGTPLALMDGGEITARRTAAASALAADFLARADARRLLIVGAGQVASLLADAMRAVRPGLTDIAVWNRSAPAAQALAQRIGGRAVTDLRTAVEQADIVSCATLATAPLVQGAWLQPGTHLDLIGSYTPQMREADGAAFGRACVYVDTPEALAKAGCVLQAVAEGAWHRDRLQGTLAGLCRGDAAGRSAQDEITLFKSVGTALEDLAAAEMVWAAQPGHP